ncbi:MAG TPA: hypothetical protein VFV99_27550 [Kofleriaceae bacterium]|nr:hypothetical protein [Kofleriaceae bacterium]
MARRPSPPLMPGKPMQDANFPAPISVGIAAALATSTMMKTAVTASLLLVASTAFADTTTTTADTLVVVTPNAPVVVTQGAAPAPQPVYAAPGAAEMPPPPPAYPAAPATANGAPQNEDWNNVSHINGIPVKVGERQDYLYKPKKFNISTNPFGYFFGYYDIAGSMALGQNLAASVAITGWDESYSTGYQLSATLPLYFRKTFSGPFLEGGLLIRETKHDYYYDCYDCSSGSTMDTDSWVGPQLLFGWHWTFDSGLNVAFAAGVAKQMGNTNQDTDGNAYFRVGYAF